MNILNLYVFFKWDVNSNLLSLLLIGLLAFLLLSFCRSDILCGETESSYKTLLLPIKVQWLFQGKALVWLSCKLNKLFFFFPENTSFTWEKKITHKKFCKLDVTDSKINDENVWFLEINWYFCCWREHLNLQVKNQNFGKLPQWT